MISDSRTDERMDGLLWTEKHNPFFARCNFSDMEIEMFFAKYDLDGDGIFSFDEGLAIMDDLENDKIDSDVSRSLACFFRYSFRYIFSTY